MNQLALFPVVVDPLHGFASQEELDEDLSIWYEVMMQNEKDHDEELQIWFDIMMEQDREDDEVFREDMYLMMDEEAEAERQKEENMWEILSDEAEAEAEQERIRDEQTWEAIEKENKKRKPKAIKVKGRYNKRRLQQLSRKLHALRPAYNKEIEQPGNKPG